jgi:uncharacterized protein YdhG (YjbR/CyaY superfamily)
MAEKNENSTLDADDSTGDDLSNLSDAEKAAFEKIMAEIAASMGSPVAEKENVQVDLDQNLLADDASLPGSSATNAENPTTDGGTDEEERLSAEQQAALEQIMAEINGETPSAADGGSINAETFDDPQPSSDTHAEAIFQPEQGLSIEAFDAELDKLLSQTETAVQPDGAFISGEDAAKSPSADSESFPEAIAETSLGLSQDEPLPPDKPTGTGSAASDAKLESSAAVAQEDSPKPTPSTKLEKTSPPQGGKGRKRGVSLSQTIALLLLAAVVATGAYVAFSHYRARFTPADNRRAIAVKEVTSAAPTPNATSTAGNNQLPVAEAKAAGSRLDMSAQLDRLQTRIAEGRAQIQQKTIEIQELMQYYETGAIADIAAIEQPLATIDLPEFNTAMADKRFELGLKSIQRRKIYQAKLEVPLRRLAAISEELLYHERIIGLYQLLQESLVSLPMAELQHKVDAAVNSSQGYIGQLTIDDIEVAAPSLESLWQQIRADFKTKQERSALLSPLNRAIGEEICRGDLTRLSRLTVLSDESARCLSQWTGKDLYLNGLNELSPEIARTLSHWPGESLSLNGLQSLSVESARYLAQWRGKHLSLNGLTALSGEVTRHLSAWKGAQLEMIGLQTIGPWQNYSTRLYLSEKLRKQLEQ